VAPPVTGLTLPKRVTRRPVLQKVRHHTYTCPLAPPEGRADLTHHSALTVCKQMVSGSISFPSRGAFHLSLTVLVHYRSPGYLALGSGLPSFPPGSSCPAVLRIFMGTHHSPFRFDYRAVTLFGRPFQARSSTKWIFDCAECVPTLTWVLQHRLYNGSTLSRTEGLG
jgi:hypothetical protein